MTRYAQPPTLVDNYRNDPCPSHLRQFRASRVSRIIRDGRLVWVATFKDQRSEVRAGQRLMDEAYPTRELADWVWRQA